VIPDISAYSVIVQTDGPACQAARGILCEPNFREITDGKPTAIPVGTSPRDVRRFIEQMSEASFTEGEDYAVAVARSGLCGEKPPWLEVVMGTPPAISAAVLETLPAGLEPEP